MTQYAALNDATGPTPLSTLNENEEDHTIELANDRDTKQSIAKRQL